jgi:2-dehydropantoate 2-reductase
MGSGGVGGYFGGRLAQAGYDVGFVARGEQLAALREQGLFVESSLGNIHLPKIRASDNPLELGHPDYVLLCVKLWDTDPVLGMIKQIVAPNTSVLSLQNGVQKEEIMCRVLGKSTVLGGVCYISSKVRKPGVITHTGTMQKLVFGECEGQTSTRTQPLLQACQRAGIEAEISSDIRKAIWEKFVFLVGTSACTTTMQAPLGPIRAHPKTRAFLLDVMREVVAVARAHGIQLDSNFAQNRLEFCDTLPAEMTSSMHSDLQQGKRLEVEWLSGAVAALGQDVKIETPLNRTVNDILTLRAGGI